MRLLPVVARELSTLSRRPGVYWTRAAVAFLTLLIMAWVALFGAAAAPPGLQGRLLFNTVSNVAFFFCLLAGVRATADALSEEKREGTLGLLFLTDLKGYDVTLGKFVSRSATSFYCGLATAPTLAMAFLLGGTGFDAFVLRTVCLLNTLFFSLAVGILVSTFSQRERSAMSGALGIIFMATAGPYIVAGYHAYSLELRDAMLPGFLIYSPFYSLFVSGQAGVARLNNEDFWLSIAFSHLLGWLCLVVAGASVAAHAHADRPRGRVAEWIHEMRQRWSYGRAHQRVALRGRLLDRGAFYWLAGRDRLKRRYPWIFLLLFCGLWTFFYFRAPEVMFDLPIVLTALWFVHMFLKVWVASEVAARFIEDRRTNALELLLTTPLNEREIARGQGLALLRQFGGPVALLVVFNVIGALLSRRSFGYGLSTDNGMSMFTAGVVVLVADLIAIWWVAMWRSLHLRGTNRTILQTTGIVVLAPIFLFWLVFQAGWVLAIMFRVRPLEWSNSAWLWAGFCVVYDVILAAIARHAFYRQFRTRATEPFESADRRALREDRAVPKSPVVPEAAIPFLQRRLVRVGIAFVGLLIILIAAASIRRESMQARVERKLQQVRAKGEPVTPMEMASWMPAPHPDQSAFALLVKAQRQVVRLQIWQSVMDLDRARSGGTAPDYDAIRQIVRTNALALKTLEQLPGRRSGPLNSEALLLLRPNSLSDMIALARLSGLAALREGDEAEAARAVSILLQMARVFDGHVVMMGLRQQALDVASMIMSRAAELEAFAPEQWRQWREILGAIDNASALQRQLAIARVEGLQMFELPAEVLWQRFGRTMSPFPTIFAATLRVRGFVGQHDGEILEFLEWMDRCEKAAAMPYREGVELVRIRKWGNSGLTGRELILPHAAPAFQWIYGNALSAEARRLVLSSACGVETFRRLEGKLPLQPTDDPAFAHPLDPFDGAPLRYVAKENGYVIYSIGENLKDDGGAVTNRRRGLDISFAVDFPAPAQSR